MAMNMNVLNLSNDYLDRLNENHNREDVIQEYLENIGDPYYMDNLQHLCEWGGYPDENLDPEYSIDEVSRQNDLCNAVVSVYFDEKVPSGGCEDIFHKQHCVGKIVMSVDLLSGDIKWSKFK